MYVFFFFQAEDGIRDLTVTGVQTCALPILSTLIGTARGLGKLKDKWHGTIIFIGQPAEETAGGARALLKDGLYTRWPKPNYVLGLHDDAEVATGQSGDPEGYCYANGDSGDVTVRGVGGHGPYPH